MRQTLRLRLTVLYGSVCFAGGALLLVFVCALLWSGGSTREPGSPVTVRQSSIDLPTLLTSSAVGLAGTVVISFLLGWIIAGRALSPLRTMTATAQAISAGTLHSRIGLDSPYEEFRELGATFDDLFERLDASFQSQRHFVANAAHELRTPLTVERALLQVTLADPQATVESMRSACEELLTLGTTQQRLVESLLTLAESEQGVEQWEPLDLAAITAEAVRARQPEAERRGLRLDATLGPATSAGDTRLVESLVANLLDNALRHNVPGGWVQVRTDGSSLTVRNGGAVIPAGDVERLFLPFQRSHRKRIRHPAGHGLGLAIVRAIATAHGATVTARAPQSGGLDVRVDFRQ